MRALSLLALLFVSLTCHAIGADQPAPPLTARLIDGHEFSLARHRGEVVVLDFWACWCAPCLDELEALKQLDAKYRGQGLTILAINTDDPEDRAKVEHITQELPFALAMAADVEADGFGRIWRLPMTFVVDRAGVLRLDGGAGPRHSYDLPELEAILQPLLAETVR